MEKKINENLIQWPGEQTLLIIQWRPRPDEKIWVEKQPREIGVIDPSCNINK